MSLIRSALLAAALPVLSHGSETKVHEFRLDNGLKVLIQEDHRAPVAVSQVWYKVGSSYEYGGLTGVSHMLEHMMFKGTKKHPAGEFSRIIAANGGSENAFTGQDYTAYFQTLERSRLTVSFDLEADRMRNLQLSPPEFAKEQQVVIEERRMRTDDQPRAKMEEHFQAVAFTSSAYQNPVIGWPDDITGLTVNDLNAWYQLWYAPNNATLVVVGDVDPNATFALAKRHFGPLKPSTLPPIKPRAEVEQFGPRRITARIPAKLPYLIIGYKSPALKTVKEPWEAYALEVASGILDGGNSARFSSRLVRGEQVAASTGVGYDLYSRMSTLFTLEGTPAQDKSLGDLEAAFRREITRLQNELVAADELARVKAQVMASKIYQRDSIFYQAMQLGLAETVGLGWNVIDDYVTQVNQITPEQIQQVARKYLTDDHSTIAHLEPQPLPDGSAPPDEGMSQGGRHVR